MMAAMRSRLLFVGATVLLAGGCAAVPDWPTQPLTATVVPAGRQWSYDLDGDRRPDYWQQADATGRITELRFADRTGAPGETIALDAIDPQDVPHFLIVLDGVPFELVDELHRQGHFRLFYPPSRVISPFPAMTDLALNRLFHAGRSRGYQATYYDRAAGKLVGGTFDYLEADNSPWLTHVDYRCSWWLDAQAYLNPRALWAHELRGIQRTFDAVGDAPGRTVAAYSVATAGLGTRGGREAILTYLHTVDRLCQQIVYQRRGRVKLTVAADHGQDLLPHRRVSFTQPLADAGFRRTQRIDGPRDVVAVSYGLVTYAAFWTDSPAGVAEVLADHEAVDWAAWRTDADAVEVVSPAGRGTLRHADGGWRYDVTGEDPLRLGAILAALRRTGRIGDGVIPQDALFAATVEHDYPDPLRRLWEAFKDLVERPADVIANLADDSCHGSKFFHVMIGDPASTHGSMGRRNSTTFVMTQRGPLPSVMTSDQVLPALGRTPTTQPGP